MDTSRWQMFANKIGSQFWPCCKMLVWIALIKVERKEVKHAAWKKLTRSS